MQDPDVRLDLKQGSWLVLSWISGSVVSAFIFGFLADVIGRRMVLALSQALYYASWFILGSAPSLTWLVFGRCVQGGLPLQNFQFP